MGQVWHHRQRSRADGGRNADGPCRVVRKKGERARRDIPVGRFAKPGEIAAAARCLASEEAGIVNGAVPMADGGFSVK
ncbi:SDR family oxidoreductase [Mesorhizobium sp.]|uniref:SDR family oxidoreductase n=1 Tax=Mesorhizobium sp. TaxID=1871066 RepID=UPI0026006B26|nr:SDR family oxidoreductase [Mesorhizobium sp.]